MIRQALLLCAFVPVLITTSVAAAEPGQPTGHVILTVSGNIGVTNAVGSTASFDLATLDALPQTSFETSTIWTSGVTEYSGVELAVLLDALDADGETLLMTALNDYAIEMPVSEARSRGPILATRANGDVLSVRDKGPIWVIFPFDDNAAYRTEVTYSRSIWQLKSISVED